MMKKLLMIILIKLLFFNDSVIAVSGEVIGTVFSGNTPVKDIEIVLFDENDSVLGKTNSDQNGKFILNFESIKVDYSLKLDENLDSALKNIDSKTYYLKLFNKYSFKSIYSFLYEHWVLLGPLLGGILGGLITYWRTLYIERQRNKKIISHFKNLYYNPINDEVKKFYPTIKRSVENRKFQIDREQVLNEIKKARNRIDRTIDKYEISLTEKDSKIPKNLMRIRSAFEEFVGFLELQKDHQGILEKCLKKKKISKQQYDEDDEDENVVLKFIEVIREP
jgi:hypothetical protein